MRFQFFRSIRSCTSVRSPSTNPVVDSKTRSVARYRTAKSTSSVHIRKSEQIDQLLQDGLAFQAAIRVLQPSLAYVRHPLDGRRVFIFGSNRLRALQGDIVLVRISPLGLWRVFGTESEGKMKDVLDEISVPPTLVVDDAEPTATDITISSDETLATEFVEPSSFTPSPDSQPSVEYSRPPSRFHNLFSCKTLFDLASAPSQSTWPPNLPLTVDLTESPNLKTPLPCPSLMRTGVVIAILKKNPRSRRLMGHIAFQKPEGGRFTRHSVQMKTYSNSTAAICLFVPSSPIHSLVVLDAATVPKDVLANTSLGMKTTYVCRITSWSSQFNLPFGILEGRLGDANELEPATQRILLQHGLEDKEFSPEHLKNLPTNPEDFVIPESEYLTRRDFRSRCILSIDPASAKDIDDALHIRQLGSDLFEVGIHIADVSYFVKPDTPLDDEAANRTTSIYLVQRVIPMLPEILSQHLCSLQPSTDKLAFSVVLTVRSSGEITNTWFGRSIIRSRAKLSYDQALALLEHTHLDMQDTKFQQLAKLLPQPESPFTLVHVHDSLVKLNHIARNLRKQRIANGALTLQKSKIEFDLPSTTFDPDPTEFTTATTVSSDQQTVWPRGYSIQAPNLSHQLIEEWMLAANQAVAGLLFKAFQNHLKSANPSWCGALLRRHSPPSKEHIQEIIQLLSSGGITLPDGSSSSISATLHRHNEKLIESGCSEKKRIAIMGALSHLIYVRMKMATYFSLDELSYSQPLLDESVLFEHTWHYGLNVPLYTHFTSPIRRYADLLVHRQLDAILGQSSNNTNVQKNPSTTPPRPQSLLKLALKATWCNHQRMMSRRVQEASQLLFLTACLRDCGPLQMDATILDLSSSQVKLFLSDFGLIVGCPLKKFLVHTPKWDVITSNKQDNSNNSTADSTHRQTKLTILVEFPSDATQQPSSDQTVIRKEIRCLTVVPCRVYSQSDRLALSAEYIPNDDLAESTDTLSNNPATT